MWLSYRRTNSAAAASSRLRTRCISSWNEVVSGKGRPRLLFRETRLFPRLRLRVLRTHEAKRVRFHFGHVFPIRWFELQVFVAVTGPLVTRLRFGPKTSPPGGNARLAVAQVGRAVWFQIKPQRLLRIDGFDW